MLEFELLEKDNKIYSYIHNRWFSETPKEYIKQVFLIKLLNQYGYRPGQIDDVTNSNNIDFIIWRTEENKIINAKPLIIAKCKIENLLTNDNEYLKELDSTKSDGAIFFVVFNTKYLRVWYVSDTDNCVKEIEDIPYAKYLYKSNEDLAIDYKEFKENEFADLLHQCHNIIRNREKLDPVASFDEIAKILFLKVYVERNQKTNLKNNILTLEYVEEAEKFEPNYIERTFERTKTDFGKDKIFSKDEKINLRSSTVKAIIQKLEKYNLSTISNDFKGIAFERFLGKTFRGEIGQFFTPRPIVDFMVNMVEPREGDIICDPASGSGGFLIKYFEIVKEKIMQAIDNQYNHESNQILNEAGLSGKEKAKKLMDLYVKLQKELDINIKDSRIWKLTHCYIYGTDANERMARTSKMNMIMHGDGHGGIFHHDGFINVDGIFEERFDIVLTNPPFGQSVNKEDIILTTNFSDSDTIEYVNRYGNAYKKSQEVLSSRIGQPIISLYQLPKGTAIKTEYLFIERCLALLKPGGRLGIVLPEGVFNNPSLSYVRHFAEDRAFITAIISLPPETFASSNVSVKASLLFMKKYTLDEYENWHNILNESLKEVMSLQEEERNINKNIITSNASSETDKRLSQKRLKELDDELDSISRQKARERFNYPIFMCEAEKIGIDPSGETTDNELPQILNEYQIFRNKKSTITTALNSYGD